MTSASLSGVRMLPRGLGEQRRTSALLTFSRGGVEAAW